MSAPGQVDHAHRAAETLAAILSGCGNLTADTAVNRRLQALYKRAAALRDALEGMVGEVANAVEGRPP